MKEILKHKKLKRSFLITIGVLLLLILACRFFILPIWEPSLKDGNQLSIQVKDPAWLTIVTRLLDSLFVSLLVTVSIALYLTYIEISEEEKKFDIIEPFKIKSLFEKARMQTTFWYFSGGTGRYTRAVTIPELSKISKGSNKHITVKMQIIDPDDSLVCKNYSNYRTGLRSSEKNSNPWTPQYVRNEILATIASATIYKSLYPLLEISVAVKNSFSTMRIDLSGSSAIITKEDPKEPALVCNDDSFLYRTYVEEIHQTFKECRQLNLPNQFSHPTSTLTNEIVKEILDSIGLSIPASSSECEAVCEILKKNENPYG